MLTKFIEESKAQNKTACLILLCFNRLECARHCFSSLFETTFFPHKLVVVDNGSWDGTVEYLKDLRRENKIDHLILLPENTGVKGVNYGLKVAGNAEYFLPLANDLQFYPYWCTKICYVLAKLPNIGIVGTASAAFWPKLYSQTQNFHGIQIAFTDTNPNPPCFNRKVFEKVGFFRTTILFAGMEADHYVRTQRAGFRNGVVINEPTILHAPRVEKNGVRVQVSFKMKNGMDYQEWKVSEHRKLRDAGDIQALPKLTYIGTDITDEEINRYSWNP